MSRLNMTLNVYCSRCRKLLAVKFSTEGVPPVYCLGCWEAQEADNRAFEEQAEQYRRAARAPST